MANVISILTQGVANKIAAGEVVEGPASVVKELVENALDARSTAIEVCIENGGIDRIQVRDNGEGMSADDALLCLKRHATSKIVGAEDLNHISTLGFRGEALPSIVSVSKLELITREKDSIEGTCIVVNGGEIKKQESIGCPLGTVVTVKQLFYNTPARLKYLKSTSTEFGKISDFINRLSLSYPSVSFSLFHNGRKITQTPGKSNILETIAAIYGKDLAKNMLPVACKNDGMNISGFIARPTHTRSSRHYQSFFVNDRYIRSKLMSDALQEAFHTLLPVHRYPIGILYLTCSPTHVDVNVHPAKMEVRFRYEKAVYQLVLTSIKNTLGKAQLIPEIISEQWKEDKKPVIKPIQNDFDFNFSQKHFNETSEKDNHCKEINSNDKSLELKPINEVKDALEKVCINSVTVKESPPKSKESFKIKNELVHQSYQVSPKSSEHLGNKSNHEQSPSAYTMIPIGQIDETYIVCQDGKNMVLIDQHAAHERILYEKFMKETEKKQISSQILLIPETIELTPQEYEIIVQNIYFLENIGLDVECFGQNTFIVRAIPAFLEQAETKDFVLAIIDQVMTFGKGNTLTECIESTVIMMSCKAAIKAGKRLELNEMHNLITQLAQTKMPYTCPHGRPTTIKFTGYELEKMFKRVQ